MYNVILFWLVIFGAIYIFTKKEDKQDDYEESLNRERDLEDKRLEIPCRRDEIARLLGDGIDKESKSLEFKRFGSRCFNCGTKENLELDHHLPLSRGYPLKGEDIGSNTVVLCRACNKEKGDKLPYEYYTEEKLRQLEEMGIRSHLYYSPAKMIELENLLVGEKLKKLKDAITKEIEITFTYYDMTKILFVEERIKVRPLRLHNQKNIIRCGVKRDWFLEGEHNKFYNVRWIFNIKIDG